MNLIKKPNLPDKKISKVLISGEFQEYIKELNNLGVNTITTSACNVLMKQEAFHADLQALHIDDIIYVLKECVNLQNNLKINKIPFNIIKDDIKENYPLNVKLNMVVMGDKIICNSKTAYKEISNKYNIIHVNQGYTKCSTAIVNENAVITSDESIYKACLQNKIDVLKISVGGIILNGFDYGFIGGCCGLIDKNILAFCGNINLHRDSDNIKSFCKNYKVDILNLSNGNLTDIGGILPLI